MSVTFGGLSGIRTGTSRTGAETNKETNHCHVSRSPSDPDGYPEEGNGPAENRHLCESNPVQEKLLELKVELEQSKLEIAHLTERLEELPVCSLCALLPYDMSQSVKTKIACV